jgi:glutathione synthase/RimK-type ligase-like ATP-grasp enzyme
MILLCGIPSEFSLRRVHDELAELGASAVVFNQRSVLETTIDYEVVDGAVVGALTIRGEAYPLESFAGVYHRMMDDRQLPEVRGEAEDSAVYRHSRDVHDAFYRWFQLAPAVMLNRPDAMASNGSKPYQSQLISAQGLSVPATLVTTDPEAVLDFRVKYGRLIYKSVSGARSVVRELGDADLSRLEHIRWCPVQFQEYVSGQDVRVHVVGEAVFASSITSDAADYRYAVRDGRDPAQVRATDLGDELAEACVRLTAALGLEFSGIDLRMTPEGQAVCFEVNPSPAFSYYESHTGQPIAAAVAQHLARSESIATPTPG